MRIINRHDHHELKMKNPWFFFFIHDFSHLGYCLSSWLSIILIINHYDHQSSWSSIIVIINHCDHQSSWSSWIKQLNMTNRWFFFNHNLDTFCISIFWISIFWIFQLSNFQLPLSMSLVTVLILYFVNVSEVCILGLDVNSLEECFVDS